MAEAVFNNVCSVNNFQHSAFSRGTSVFFAQPINPKSREALASNGICLNEHLAQQITENDIKSADLILTMSSSHKMELKSKFSFAKDKIFTLCEKAYGRDCDINDPFGQGQDVYNNCYSEISEAVNKLLCLI